MALLIIVVQAVRGKRWALAAVPNIIIRNPARAIFSFESCLKLCPEYSADRKDGEYREAGIFLLQVQVPRVVSRELVLLLIGYIFQFVEGYSGGILSRFYINLPETIPMHADTHRDLGH